MSTKQLYEKTSEGMKEVSPLVVIEDIYARLSDTPLEALVALYNHVKCEWRGTVADTRRTVPLFLRRSGLFITYNNGTKYITEFFSAGVDQITTEGWVKDSNWTPVPDEDYISAGVKPGVGSIGYEQLNDNLKQLFREKVNVTNFPDDEDIVSVDNMLKLKDREVNAANFQSKGYVILRKNLSLVNGVVKNILTQNMINKPNTIYEIRYDFDLNGETINIPENCTLKFEGGSLNNGTLNFNNSVIKTSQKEIFNTLNINGSILYFNLSWFKIADYLNSAFYIQQAINVIQGTGGILYIPKGIYYLKPSNDLLYHLLITDSIKIEGDKNETILRRVDINGKEPKEENYNNIQYGNLISITSNIKKNINISIKNIVLDGNQNWQHDKFGNLKDKLIRIYNKNVTTNNIIYDNVQFLNNASEAAYNECYVDETKTIFTNCKFVNIGGSAGNSGGNDVLYDNCLFESAGIEHSWYGSEHIGLCVIRNCTFHNTYKTVISSNYQQKVTYDIQKGKTLIIENCNFINDTITNILYNIIIVESSDNVFIKNNTFTNVSSNANSRIVYANSRYNHSKFVNFENNNIINTGFISFEKISSKTNMIIRNNIFYCHKNNSDIYNINKQYNDNNCYIYDLDIKSNTDTTINIPIFINNKIQLISLSADNNSTVNIKLKNINNFLKLDKTFTSLKDNTEYIASIEQSYSNDTRRTITINSDIDITLKMIVLESNTIPKNALLDDSTKVYNILINNYAKGDSNNRPTNVNVGTLYKNKETNKWEIFNGTSWENLNGIELTQ